MPDPMAAAATPSPTSHRAEATGATVAPAPLPEATGGVRRHRARHRAGHRSARPRAGAGLLWPLAALVTVGLVGARTLRGMPLPEDGALTIPAFELLRGDADVAPLSPRGLGTVLTAGYAAVTRAFDRYPTLTGAGRELLLVLLLVSAVLVWRTARRLGLGDPASAVAVLAFGAVPFLAAAHVASTPAAFAVPSLLVAGWLLTGGRPGRVGWVAAWVAAWVVAAAAGVLAVLLAPDTLLLVTAGLAAAVATGQLARGWPPSRRLGAAALLAAGTVVLRLGVGRWDPQPADPGRWSAAAGGLLAVGAVLLLVGLLAAWWLPQLRAPGVALTATTLLAVLPPSGRLPALLLCLPIAALLLAALLDTVVQAAVVHRAGRRRAARALAGVVVAAAVLAAVVGLVTAPRSTFGAAQRSALLAWADQQLPAGARLSAGARLTAELAHAHADPALLGAGTVDAASTTPSKASTDVVLQVTRGAVPAGSSPVARFGVPGEDAGALLVVDPHSTEPTPAQLAHRRTLAAAVLANPHTSFSSQATDVLRSARIDPRLLSLLAGLVSQRGVAVSALPAVASEGDRTPVRQAVIGAVGGSRLTPGVPATRWLLSWLDAQCPPFAPASVQVTDDGVLMGFDYISDPDAVVDALTP